LTGPVAGRRAASTAEVWRERLAPHYALLCVLLGLALGQIPRALHGPIPYKFDVHYLDGDTLVWAFYSARMLIGVWVGITRWPERFWLRGPLCGLLAMGPVVFVSLATPECGWPCFTVNLSSAACIGLTVGALAFALTGRHRGGSARGRVRRTAQQRDAAGDGAEQGERIA
jgi:hypothetical protein